MRRASAKIRLMKLLAVTAILVFSFLASAEVNLSVRDLDGNFITFPSSDTKMLVMFVADVSCPVSNQYIPKLNEIYAKYRKEGIQFLFLYSGNNTLWPVARHINEFKIQAPAVIDFDHRVFQRLQPQVFSEVFILDRDLKIVYRGRVDDQFALGQTQPSSTTHELEDVIENSLEKRKSAVVAVSASGCATSDQKRKSELGFSYTKDIASIVKNRCYSCQPLRT